MRLWLLILIKCFQLQAAEVSKIAETIRSITWDAPDLDGKFRGLKDPGSFYGFALPSLGCSAMIPSWWQQVAVAVPNATWEHDQIQKQRGRSFLTHISLFKGKKFPSQRPSANILSYPLSKITSLAAREVAKWISATSSLYRNRTALPARKVEGGAAVGGMLGKQSHPPTWINPWDHGQGTYGTFTPHTSCPHVPSPLPLYLYPVVQLLLLMLVCSIPP